MTETMKIPLGSYEDLLFVKELLAMHYSMLERSLLLSYGQHDIKWCQQFTAHQLLVIGSKQKTPFNKVLYMTLMEVKHKADCEQPLANDRRHELECLSNSKPVSETRAPWQG
jgi:hypothetical protein